jgi:hypothetical protein
MWLLADDVQRVDGWHLLHVNIDSLHGEMALEGARFSEQAELEARSLVEDFNLTTSSDRRPHLDQVAEDEADGFVLILKVTWISCSTRMKELSLPLLSVLTFSASLSVTRRSASHRKDS